MNHQPCADLVRLASRAGVDPRTHLSPALPGSPVNESPTLGELAADRRAFSAWSERAADLAAGLRAGRARVGRDAAGPHFALAGGRAALANDAAATAARAAPAPPWASGQFNDRFSGSWGASVRGDAAVPARRRAATIFRWAGGAWRPHAEGYWNVSRGRFDDLSAPLPAAVAEGLAASILSRPEGRAAASLGEARRTGWFGGVGDLPEAADPSVSLAIRLASLASCEDAAVQRHRHGTKAREAAAERARHAGALAVAALDDVCGVPDAPAPPGSPCDSLLGALEVAARPSCATAPGKIPCPRVVSRATLSEWREGAMPPLGPYETTRPHAVGDDPCCFYHPSTQERLRLQAAVRARVLASRPGAGEGEVLSAVAAAEGEHPLAAVWSRCDDAAREEAERGGVGAASGARGSATGMAALVAFYNALRAGEDGAARGLWSAMQREFADFAGAEMPTDPSEPDFWDVAHREAHDSGNIGYVQWAHRTMKALRLPVFH